MKSALEVRRLRSMVARHAAALESASAETVIRWACDTFGHRLCATASMADAVVVHLGSRFAPGLDVLFLDTGYHFAETVDFRALVSLLYDVNVVDLHVESPTVGRSHNLFASDPDACCRLRKVDPLHRALEGYDAWVTGIRRTESPHRADTPIVSWDAVNQVVKVAPLASWTDDMVAAYVAEHALPQNRLTELGYASIGCQPCTSLPHGADARSGRWPGLDKSECGLHLGCD